MSNFDNIFSGVENTAVSTKTSSSKMSKEDYANVERQRREKLYSMADEALIAVSNKQSMFKQYLDVQGRFLTYSTTNAALILAQRPDAAFFRNWKWWKKEHSVDTRDKNGFYILESSGKSYLRDDMTTGRYINAKEVFDAKDVGVEIGNRVYDTYEVLRALYSASEVKFQRDTNGVVDAKVGAIYDPAQKVILVNGDIPTEYMFGTMAREACDVLLQQTLQDQYDPELHKDYAECAAYMLCVHYGQDTGCLDIDNIRIAEGMDNPKEIKEELTVAREAASTIEKGISVTFYRNEAGQQKTDVEQGER